MAMPEAREPQFTRTLARVIGLPLLLMLALIGIFLWLLSTLLAVSQRVDHSDQVLAQARTVQELMLDQETGLRGYLLNDSALFLEPYQRANGGIVPALDALHALVADNPDQMARQEAIRAKSAAWRSYAVDLLAQQAAGTDVRSEQTQRRGKALMDSFRQEIGGFIRAEEQLRDERTQTSRRTTQLTVTVSIGAGLLIGALLTLFLRNQLTALSQRYELALHNARQREAELREQTDALREQTDALERTTATLEERNRELDQFAYVTSHDLKAPLRGIANLSQWIEEDLGESVTDEIRRQMELLRGRAHRMEALIDGILQYSRVGRVQATIEPVDVGKLLREVVDLLSPPAGFAVIIDPGMPTVSAERVRLQQVFSNLLGNAIKHHAHPSDGRVRVSVEEGAAAYTFRVSDNGPGIAPQFHERIFVIFQTLASRDKVEGSGLGLSLVKKIVEHAGGRIWVESREGAGTTFCFTWPRQQNAPPQRPTRTTVQARSQV